MIKDGIAPVSDDKM